MDDVIRRQALKIVIASLAIVLAVLWHFVKRGKIRGKAELCFDVALILVAAASVFAYFEFGWLRFGRYMNPHDVYHYYIGAKYSQEHGYFDLYRCSLIADKEMQGIYKQGTIRNLETHRTESAAQVLKEKDKYKAHFTPERWEEFKKDIAYFQSVMPAYKWNRVLGDKGYNATPVWNSVARWLCEHAPTDSVWAMRCLTYIDLVCLVLMFLTVWAAFGWRVMLFAVIFHGTNYFMAFVHIKGAFMRLDWLALVIMALCLLRLRWYKTAGGLLAYAGMARVFPVIFGFGLGAKMVFNGLAAAWDRIKKHTHPTPLNRDYIAFFLALAVVSVLLVGASAFYDGGFHLWRNFFSKIAVHDKDISTTRAGFKYIFLWSVANKAQVFEQRQIAWWSIIIVVLLVTAFLARKAEDYETVAIGFIPVFFMTAPTFYYYVMLLVPMFLFLPKIERASRLSGVILMFLLSIAAYIAGFRLEHHFKFFFVCSCMLLGLCAYLGLCVLIPNRTPAASQPAPEAKQWRPLGPHMRRILPFMAGFGAALLLGGIVMAGVTYFGDALPKPEVNKSSPRRSLVFVGDVMLSRNVAKSVAAKGGDYTYPFQATATILQEADAAFCNLECPISGQGAVVEKNYNFNADPAAVNGLAYAGFDVVSVANNHILDSGPPAMEDTLRLLDEKGIRPAGLCVNDAPQEPVILDLDGVRVGYLAYCDPVPKYSYAREFYVFDKRPAKGDRETLSRDIAMMRPKVDIIVVSMHWGVEYVLDPSDHTRELGRFIIDQGADIVAGHHPHVQQEPEVYKSGLILYSMGNFVFDQHSRPPTRVSRIYRVVVGAHGVERAEYLPLEIPKGEWQPRPTAQAFVPIAGLGGVRTISPRAEDDESS